jgi:hypothetical protein
MCYVTRLVGEAHVSLADPPNDTLRIGSRKGSSKFVRNPLRASFKRPLPHNPSEEFMGDLGVIRLHSIIALQERWRYEIHLEVASHCISTGKARMRFRINVPLGDSED